MKNQVTELFDNMSDKDLLLTIKEVKESDVTGYIPLEGKIRELMNKWVEITQLKGSSEMVGVITNVYKQGAYRFLNSNNK